MMSEAAIETPAETREWTERRRNPDGSWSTAKRQDPPRGPFIRDGNRLVPLDEINNPNLPRPVLQAPPPSAPPRRAAAPNPVPIDQHLAELAAQRRKPTPPRPAPSPADLAGRPAVIPDAANRLGCIPGWYPGKPAPRSRKEILADIDATEKRKTELLRELQGFPAA